MLGFFISFFLVWPLTRKRTDRYLFEQLKIVRLRFVMRSRSIRMSFEWLGLSVQKTFSRSNNCSDPFEKCLSVRTAAVLNSEFGKIQPFKQKSFSVRQRESDQNALDLPNCHTFVTEQWQHLSLLASVYFKDIALQMWRRLSFLSLSLHTNRRTRCETKLFARLPSCS